MKALRRAYIKSTAERCGGSSSFGVDNRPYGIDSELRVYSFATSMRQLRRALETFVRCWLYGSEQYLKLQTEAADFLIPMNIIFSQGISGHATANV